MLCLLWLLWWPSVHVLSAMRTLCPCLPCALHILPLLHPYFYVLYWVTAPWTIWTSDLRAHNWALNLPPSVVGALGAAHRVVRVACLRGVVCQVAASSRRIF